ncbi:BREX system Lon protease-like protein BrxL [uncultured Cetobacterium sp.]|uniref:BREX system Lon protease-like protein BrxL n=1 Tax=uncultured Cetobacterium sp. TaxID=527638 RepID=UPI0026301A8A|nr:BREX system Lon protease-like protein BrxL [uncultured Cetobacterium sp.]
MELKKIEIAPIIDGVKKEQKTTYLELQKSIPKLEDELILKNYRSYIENKDIKEKIKKILLANGLCDEKNNTYVIFLELTKLIPYIQNNYNLILLGEGGLGKSSPFTTVFPFNKIISGVPTVASLRGSEKDMKSEALLEDALLVFEEIADDVSSKGSIISLLKTFLASGRFPKNNREEIDSKCSIVITSNETSSINSYEALKNKDIFSPLPTGVKDFAFLNRFNGMLPHYRSLIHKREYATSGEAIHCLHLHQIFSKLKELPNKIYIETSDKFDDRELGKINETINGFVKLFYIDKEPDKSFLNFIIEWAKHICSLTNPRIALHYPFNYNSIGLLSELYFKQKQVESICYLSKDRILIKYEEYDCDGYNAEILALSGFGKSENEFDLDFLKCHTDIKTSLIHLEKLTDYKLRLRLNGNLATSRKYNKNGEFLNNFDTDHEYNDLLISLIDYQSKVNSPPTQIAFRGVPKFFEKVINTKIKKIFNLDNNKNPISKTCYVVNDSDIYFLNYHKIMTQK